MTGVTTDLGCTLTLHETRCVQVQRLPRGVRCGVPYLGYRDPVRPVRSHPERQHIPRKGRSGRLLGELLVDHQADWKTPVEEKEFGVDGDTQREGTIRVDRAICFCVCLALGVGVLWS